MSWTIDPAHSQIEFSARHMMISNVRGRFEKFSGTFEFDEEDPTTMRVEIAIDAASINTKEAQRDDHLRSADFLNTELYPNITFKSTAVEKVDEHNLKVKGDLTIADATRPVTLDVEYAGTVSSPWGTVNTGFSARARISRKDFGLTWNHVLETGGFLVGDEIKIDIELEAIKQQSAEPVAAAA